MTKPATIPAGHVAEIPLAKLQPDPNQPRKNFEEASLKQLAGSIAKSGILVPLLVRPGKGVKYIIHDGERRYRAAKLAKLKTVPVLLVGDVAGDEGLRAGQLTVNNLREQLSTMEIARTLALLQREHFKSPNELSAYLDKAGLPAMKPAQIKDAIALVDLPDWLQAMIDAGQVEASAAVLVEKAMPYPEVLKVVEAAMKQQVTWSRQVRRQDVIFALREGFRKHGADLDRTKSWNDGTPGCVYFNPKTAGKKLPDVVSIEGAKFCMDLEAFEKLNKEAREAGLGPGGKKRDAPAPAKQAEQGQENKEEQRARTLGQKARDYLHRHLVDQIVRHMQGDAERHQIEITDELLAWRSLGKPGCWRDGVPNYHARDRIEEAAGAAGTTCIEDFFAADGNKLEALKLAAAIEVARDLSWRDTQVVCHQLWGSAIEKVWSMDEAFLQLFRKAELVHLAETHGLEPPGSFEWSKLKLAQQRAEILTRKSMGTIGRPQILQDLYAAVDKPFVPYSQRGDDYYDDEEDFEDVAVCVHGVNLDLVDCMECQEHEVDE